MQQYISADWIFPVETAPIKNNVIGIEADGAIMAMLTSHEAQEMKTCLD